MLSPATFSSEFRDVDSPLVVPLACAQWKPGVTRANTTLLHNPQGLLRLLPFLYQNRLKKEQSCANPS